MKLAEINKVNIYISLMYILFGLTIYSGCKKNSGGSVIPDPTENNSGSGGSDNGGGSQNPPSDETPEYVKTIQSAKWDTTIVSDAIFSLYYHFNDLFSAKESITVIEADLNNKDLTISIPYAPTGQFLKTSEGATSVKALAAVNGSYFDTKNGGSTVFFESQGQIISYKHSNIASYRENAGFSIDNKGLVSIIQKPTTGWESASSYDLLTSGPMLVYSDKVVNQVKASFTDDRHPRTAVGISSKNHLIAVVVDGRTNQSFGMTTEEMGKLMNALGCKSAMNMDGGGSSTAWIKGKGVVNYPSDNGKFDHGGERAVATVIAFGKKK